LLCPRPTLRARVRLYYYCYLIVRYQYLVPGNRSYTNVRRAKKPIFLAREGPGTIFLVRVGFHLRRPYRKNLVQYKQYAVQIRLSQKILAGHLAVLRTVATSLYCTKCRYIGLGPTYRVGDLGRILLAGVLPFCQPRGPTACCKLIVVVVALFAWVCCELCMQLAA